MARGRTRGAVDRRTLLVVGLLAIAVVAVALVLTGGGGSPAATGAGSVDAPDGVADDQSETLRSLDSYTLTGTTTMVLGSNVSEVHRTVEADPRSGNVRATVTNREGGATAGMRTDYYTAGESTYLRYQFEGSNGSVYERTDTATLVNGSLSSTPSVWGQFDFDRRTIPSGDTLFLVDSPDQIRGDLPTDGEIESISVRAVVDDETGLVTAFQYHLRARTAGGSTFRYDATREVTAIGETTVSAPAWLQTAKDRTVSAS